LNVQGGSLDPSSERCSSPCTLYLEPSAYTVELWSKQSKKAFHLNLREPSEVVLSPGSPFLRGLGMGLMIIGGVPFLIAAGTLYLDTAQRNASENNSVPYHSPPWVAPVEVAGLIGAGAALIGVGVFLAAQPKAKVSARVVASARHSLASRLVLTPLGVPRGAAMRAGFTF
jgi:hypothetical protein